jgi:hypothetical protein
MVDHADEFNGLCHVAPLRLIRLDQRHSRGRMSRIRDFLSTDGSEPASLRRAINAAISASGRPTVTRRAGSSKASCQAGTSGACKRLPLQMIPPRSPIVMSP